MIVGQDNNSGAATTTMLPVNTDKIRTMASNVMAASQALETSQAKQQTVAAKMRELQDEADTISCELVEAEADENMAMSSLEETIREEEAARRVYDAAVQALEEAKALVRYGKEKHHAALAKRAEVESGMAPLRVKVQMLRTKRSRFSLLAEGEMAKLQAEIAAHQSRVITSKLAHVDARLELLSNPAIMDKWGEIREVVEA